MMKCRRCPNLAQKGKRGLCDKHWRALPDSGYVPAKPIAERIELLRGLGWTYQSLSLEVGMCWEALRRTKYYKNVTRNTAHRVMAIPLEPVDGGAQQMPNVGVRRRIQALAVMGWSQELLAEKLGVTLQCVNSWHRTPKVTTGTIAKITALFDEIGMIPGPSAKTTTMARNRGWASSLAWDDIDDPTATPDCLVPVQATTRRLRALHRIGFVQMYLAERLGLDPHVISDLLRFLEPEIPWALANAAEELFEELRSTPADDPRLTTASSQSARSKSMKYGWALPDDLGNIYRKPTKAEIAVSRSTAGQVRLMRELKTAGRSNAEIARQIGVHETTIYAWLKKDAA